MFKMFKNELNRLFKMPLTLILGIVILGLTLLSTAFYSPTLKESNNINWGNKSSNEIYSTFINNDKYKNYYDSQIDKAQAILNYYTTLNGRSSEASTILSKVFGSYDELKKEIPNGDSPTLGEKYINFTNSLKNFKQTLLNFSSIEDISYIQFIIDNNEYENSLSKLSELIYQCEYYYNIFADKAEASNAIVKFYTENNYDSKLENINLSSMAFLDITINNLIEQVSSAYTKYITYIETIPNTTTFTDTSYEGAENHRLNLKNLLKGTHSISKLLEYMVDSPYLSVYTNKDCVITLQNDLDNAYIAINLNENNRKYYTSHRNTPFLFMSTL